MGAMGVMGAMGAMRPLRRLTRLIRPNQGKAKFMKPNETPPEMVWIGGRWLLKSAVEKVNAEKEEARRAMLANQQPRQHVASAVPKAEPQEPSAKCQEPSGGPAGSPSQHPAPGASCFTGPGKMDHGGRQIATGSDPT